MTSDPMRTKVFTAIATNLQNTQDKIAESLKITDSETLHLTRWLVGRGLVQPRLGATIGNDGHELTSQGEYVYRTGKPVEEALAALQAPVVSHVTNSSQFHGPVGQVAQGDGNHLEQTNNNTINSMDLSALLEIMRQYGDHETAGAVEQLSQQGDGKGAVRKLVDRFSEKAVDAAAPKVGTAVVSADYRNDVFPALMNLFSNLPWF